MRQYGAPAGNPWESDSEFLAAKARAVENRLADEEIAAGLQDVPSPAERRLAECEVGGCSLGCCP